MNLALLLLVPASAASDLTPPASRAPEPVAAVTRYDAIVAIEDTPATQDLTMPAVFIEDGAAPAIASASGTRWIA